jgi:hypothetical protein
MKWWCWQQRWVPLGATPHPHLSSKHTSKHCCCCDRHHCRATSSPNRTVVWHQDPDAFAGRVGTRCCQQLWPLCVSCWHVQVADRLTSMGVPCNLVTGQEIRRVKGARHTACTVEMADLATMVDVSHCHCSMSNSSHRWLTYRQLCIWTLWSQLLGTV